MFKHISCLIIAVIFISCSKKEEVLTEDTPEIGLKRFGPEKNSNDQGLAIFEVSDGYVSIEEINLDYYYSSNFEYQGFTNLNFRKLNTNLETINQKTYETDTHDYLMSAIQVNDSFVILENQSNADRTTITTAIKVLSSDGEILNSIKIPNTNLNPEYNGPGDLYYKDNFIYASYNPTSKSSVLMALDMQLNIIWEKTLNTNKDGKIYLDETGLIYYATIIPDSGTYITPALNILDATNGDIISSFQYPDTEKQFIIKDIFLKGDFLYLAGGTGNRNNFTGFSGVIIKIDKVTGAQESLEHWDNYGWVSHVEIEGDNLFLVLQNSSSATSSIVKTNESSNEIWKYNLKYGLVHCLFTKNTANIVFSGRTNSLDSSDILIGILDSNGEIE